MVSDDRLVAQEDFSCLVPYLPLSSEARPFEPRGRDEGVKQKVVDLR